MTQSGFAPAAAVQVRPCLTTASPCMSPSALPFSNPTPQPTHPALAVAARPSPQPPYRTPHLAPRSPQRPASKPGSFSKPPSVMRPVCTAVSALQLTRAAGGGGVADVAKQGGAEPPGRLHPGSALRVCCPSALADAKARQGARRRRSCALAHAGRVKVPPCDLVCAQGLSRPSSCASLLQARAASQPRSGCDREG